MKSDAATDDQEISEINMTPFVDIVLVILVIFMATATFVAQGKIPINLPKASQQPAQNTPKKPAVITIEKNGNCHLNDTVVSMDELEKSLNKLDASMRDAGVILRSDAQTPFSFVVEAIDACKHSGVTKFSIQTRETQL